MAENCEHCTPTRPDQLTRHRRAFIELERERDALRAEVERLQHALYGAGCELDGIATSLPESLRTSVIRASKRTYDALAQTGYWAPATAMPTGESEAGE